MQKIKSPYEKSPNKFALKAATELINEIRLREPKSDSKLDSKTRYENWIQKLIGFEKIEFEKIGFEKNGTLLDNNKTN